MLLSRDEFHAGGPSTTSVLEFLREHSDQAFSISELLDALAASILSLDDLDFASRQLELTQSIEVRVLQNKVYDTYREALGFRTR